MFYVVVLIEDHTHLCIPASWVFMIDIVKSQNYGLNCNKTKRIFFSKNSKKTPNFLLPLRSSFDPNEDACYLAKIKRTVSTMDEGLAHLQKRLGGIPPVYNEMRNRDQYSAIVDGENDLNHAIERQHEIKIEVKKELDKVLTPLRNTITKFNRMHPVCDLTIDDTTNMPCPFIDLTIDNDSERNEELCDRNTNSEENAFIEPFNETDVTEMVNVF